MAEKEPLSDKSVSHSICSECFDYYKEQWDGMSWDKYLDNFAVPVVILNSDCRVVATNEMAAKITGKSSRQTVGLLGGEALECVYSRLPGGCGKTVHCTTCTLRKIIEDTIESGKPIHRKLIKFIQLDKELEMVVSVEKIGELVSILIEKPV